MSLLSQASKIMNQDRIKKLGQEREKKAVISQFLRHCATQWPLAFGCGRQNACL